jgi:tRNA U55 pseudouridine synthase TruB
MRLHFVKLNTRNVHIAVLQIMAPHNKLKIEAVCSSETFVRTCHTTLVHNPEHHNMNAHHRENILHRF